VYNSVVMLIDSKVNHDFEGDKTMLIDSKSNHDERKVLAILAAHFHISARQIASEADGELTFDEARKVAQRLVKKGLATSEVVREFDPPSNLPGQGVLFGGAVMCVRRRAYYKAIKH